MFLILVFKNFQVYVEKLSSLPEDTLFSSCAPLAVVTSKWSYYVDQNILKGHLNKSIIDTDLFSLRCAFFLTCPSTKRKNKETGYRRWLVACRDPESDHRLDHTFCIYMNHNKSSYRQRLPISFLASSR